MSFAIIERRARARDQREWKMERIRTPENPNGFMPGDRVVCSDDANHDPIVRPGMRFTVEEVLDRNEPCRMCGHIKVLRLKDVQSDENSSFCIKSFRPVSSIEQLIFHT